MIGKRDDVAVAMPLFNEGDGIRETLIDLDSEFHAAGITATYLIQDDCSTDDSLIVLERLSPTLNGRVVVKTNEVNLRHGPTTRRAYLRALEVQCDVVVQLDSDGQFDAREVAQMVELFSDDKSIDLLIGARKQRSDPWYRILITRSLLVLLYFRFGILSVDSNSPIRIARSGALRSALDNLPENVLTPNILLTVYFHKNKFKVKYVPTKHRVRRGVNEEGTMWQNSGKTIRVPSSLIKFCWASLRQLLSYGG